MGVEPSSPCAQLEHLADLLRNRVNSQWNPSLYEVWRPKIVDDIEKQMVRRLCWDSKVPGTCMRTKAAAAPGQGLPQDPGSPAPSPTRAGRAAWQPEGSECLKLLGGIETKWETCRGGVHPLGLWTLARSLPEKLGSHVSLAKGRRVGPCWTPTLIVYRLVRKLGSVKSHALVNTGRQLICKELSCSSWLTLRVITAMC